MALTKRLADILRIKNERLESVPDAFQTDMVKVQRELLTELIAALGQLDRNGGFITLSKSNLVAVEEISSLLGQIFTQGEYLDAVTALAGEFDEQALINDSYFKEVEPDFTVPPIADEVFLTRKAGALELLLGEGVSANVSAPIKRELVSAVTTGASYTDTLVNIRALVEGTETTDGLLMRYTRQIVSDSFAVTDRSYTSVISEERGYEWFLYSGGLMDTTRSFCKSRTGKFYHSKEVQGWGNMGEWNGRMKGTDSRTIFVNAGGYNCQHSIQPVSVFAVPKPTIERNIANGNYEPSKVEADLLGTGSLSKETPTVKFGAGQRFDDYVDGIRGESLIVIDRLPKPYEIKSKGINKGSYYKASQELSEGKAGTLVSREERGKRTFIHEYGHHIDYSISKNSYKGLQYQRSMDKDFLNARNADIAHLTEKFKGRNMFEDLAKKWDVDPNYKGASDIFDSMSKGVAYDKYGMSGHGSRYYNRKASKYKTINRNNQQTETFANLFEGYSSGGAAWDNIIEHYPNQARVFEEMMNDFINE